MTQHDINMQKYADETVQLFALMFPMIHAVQLIADKLEMRAYKHHLKARQGKKLDAARIMQTAKRLRQQCDQYTEDYLLCCKPTDEQRTNVDMVQIEDANMYLYFIGRLNNALEGGMTDEELLKLDSYLKSVTRRETESTVKEEILQSFNLKAK